MKVHTIAALSTLFLYMHETNDTIYFIDTDNIHQTILVRLPPMVVMRQDETCIDYMISTNVREAFDKMEKAARSYVSERPGQEGSLQPVFLDPIRFESSRLLRTMTNKYTKSVPNKVGQFVEVVVAVIGIVKADTGWDFVYHTIDARAFDLSPPILDEHTVNTTDFF